MKNFSEALRLCLVIGHLDCHPHSMLTIIKQAIAGGVTSIQLREKNLTEEKIAKQGSQLLKILPHHIPLIINDHVAVAKFLKIPLHIGQADTKYQYARKIMGKAAIIGLSIENIRQANHFQSCDADYFGVGPVFATSSKSDAAPAIGLENLRTIVSILSPKACVAIGGVNQHNAAPVYKTGVCGIAVISAITQAENPYLATQKLLINHE